MALRRLCALVALLLVSVACSSGTAAKPDPVERAASTTTTLSEDACDGTTIEFNECVQRVRTKVEREEERTFARLIRVVHQPDPQLGSKTNVRAQLRASERTFRAYREQTCAAVFTAHSEGTWRDGQFLNCRLALTRQRTALLREIIEGKGMSAT
jgi:uncharacterized protein YecT (DUF1311 family)